MQNERIKPERSLFKWAAVTVAAVALVGAGGYAVWDKLPVNAWLSRFQFLEIKAVKITSGWPLTPQQIKGWLPAIEGRNIFLVQPGRIIGILESKPWVSSVVFRKEYPDQIQIDVTTKIPRALLSSQSQIFYVDEAGRTIDRVSSVISRELDLPLITIEKDRALSWKLDKVVSMVGQLPAIWKNLYKVSEVVLEDFPYCKVYLTAPRVEVSLNFENWESVVAQVPILIQNPPDQIGQVRRINLVFPKKAIVSSVVSN